MVGSRPNGEQVIRPGQIVNEQPRPRILVTGFAKQTADAVATIAAEVAPTVEVADDLDMLDLSEYDCAITSEEYLRITTGRHPAESDYHRRNETPPTWVEWRQVFPPHISVFRILNRSRPLEFIADMSPAEGEGEVLGNDAVILNDSVPGRHVRYAHGLPDHLGDLAKLHLAAAAKKRKNHLTISSKPRLRGEDEPELTPPIEENSFTLYPLLYGPNDEILAATYKRGDLASVWLLPDDLIGDLRAWLVVALREWHQLYPTRFPAVADWTRSERWATPDETKLMRHIRNADEILETARVQHEATVAALGQQVLVARSAGDAYERALITATGTELEGAVSRALIEVGFRVQCMDDVWPPDARREDFRITDPEDQEWVALGETKGFTKGVAETGVINLMKYSTLYAREEARTPSRQWYLANQFLREDPATRQRALSGRDNIVDSFADAGGLLVDTRDLFVLLMDVRQNPDRRDEIRKSMRTQTGRFVVPAESEPKAAGS